MKIRSFLAVMILSFFFSSCSGTDYKTQQGIKDALNISVRNAIEDTSKTDGFFNNDSIKILFPDHLKTMEKTIRNLGIGRYADDFILSMNRAAEKTVPIGGYYFLDMISAMSIDDAQKILHGSDTAATDYLRSKYYNKLKESFQPVIERYMKEFDVAEKYKDIVNNYTGIPSAERLPAFDPQEYVMNKCLEGLFFMIGQEEAKIRKDPKARVTDLLKEVFQ
ncbi:MAG: DUF4197 domain-containing protein [Candidatus Omnitrophica bacterium]|nr:DUF4197 domain-containing protein [Candidatus Omnitrophota bacterium]